MISATKIYRLPLERPVKGAALIYATRLLILLGVAIQCWLILVMFGGVILLIQTYPVSTTVVILLAFILGTVVLNVWVYRKFQIPRIKTIADVERHIELPLLAIIPENRGQLSVLDDIRSPSAEGYRHLRTSLLLTMGDQPPQTILVTSSAPSEGKTTTTVNTALSLAQTGASVIIIDCDLRRPRIHTILGISNVSGLTNFLTGERNFPAFIKTYEKLPNLKVLTSGPVPPNPADLLSQATMRQLIIGLTKNYDFIVIDSPPAFIFTDATILSAMVDGVILVVEGGKTVVPIVQQAKRLLENAGAHFLGVVLNNLKQDALSYYYVNYYTSYYTDEDGTAREVDSGKGISHKRR